MKNSRLLICLIISIITVAGCGTKEKQETDITNVQVVDDNKVIANVNGKKIKGRELNKLVLLMNIQLNQMNDKQQKSNEISPYVKQAMTEVLVKSDYIIQESQKKGYKVEESEIAENFNQIKVNFNNDKDFENSLQKLNMSVRDVKEQIRKTLLYDKYVDKEIKIKKVSEKEIKDYYDDMKKAYKDDKEINVSNYDEMKDLIRKDLEKQRKEEKVDEIINELKNDKKIEIYI